MKNIFVLLFVVMVSFGCGNLQHLRSDRVPAAPIGVWDNSPQFLLHSSLSPTQQAVVTGQVQSIAHSVGCGTWEVRDMTPHEETQQLIGTVLPGTIVVTGHGSNNMRATTADTMYYRGTNRLANVEVHLVDHVDPRTVTHQLAYALGLGEIVGGDPNLLMSTTERNEELFNSHMELLPEEKRHLCNSSR